MKRRNRLLTSIPYWFLVAGSVGAAGAGVVITLDKVGAMTTTLLDGTATGIEVYAGQSWIVVGGALLTAGLVGGALALGLAAARALIPRPASDAADAPDEDAPGPDPADEPADIEALTDTSASDTDVPADDDAGREPVVSPAR